MENPLRGRGQALRPTPPLPSQIRPQLRGSEEEQEIRPPRVEEVRQISNRINSSERGSRGQPTELISNYFPITSYTDWSLYQYRVDFNPVQERTNIQKGLLSAHKKFLGAYIFDGTMLFSIKQFKSDTTELISICNTDGQTVIITLKFTSVIKKGDYASMQDFNLLMRKCFGNLNLTLTGRNNYDADVREIEILVVEEKAKISTKDQRILSNLKEWESPRKMTDPSTGQTVILPFALKRLVKRNELNTPLIPEIETLVVEEKAKISTKDQRILSNLKEWAKPRKMTDLSTGQTVILPFALKRLVKRNELNTPLIPVQMKTPLSDDVFDNTKIMNKINIKENIQSNHSHNHHESPNQIKSLYKAIPLPPPEIINDFSNDV